MTGAALFQKLLSRPLLLGLIFIGVGIALYFVGAFYHQFINNPMDFASLLFIIAIYVGAVYHQIQGFEKK
jgi:hypothetical protein